MKHPCCRKAKEFCEIAESWLGPKPLGPRRVKMLDLTDSNSTLLPRGKLTRNLGTASTLRHRSEAQDSMHQVLADESGAGSKKA